MDTCPHGLTTHCALCMNEGKGERPSDADLSGAISGWAKAQKEIENLRQRLAESERQLELARTAKEHIVTNAKCDHMEANAQRSMVLAVLRALSLPLEDWRAESLILGKFSALTAPASAVSAGGAGTKG